MHTVMIKKLFIILASLAFAGSLHAQDNKLGFKGGLNISKVFAENADKSNPRVGYHAGVFVKLALNRFLALQPELLYSTKGACIEYNNGNVNGMANFNLNYFDIPVMGVINITRRYSIHAGPYFGILTQVTLENESTGSESFDFESELKRDNFSQTDFGIAGGIGADFGKAGFGIRYSYGLTNIGKEKIFNGQSLQFPDGNHGYFQLYLALSFL